VVLGFEQRGLVLYLLRHGPQPFFCSGCFWDKVLLFMLYLSGLHHSSPIYAAYNSWCHHTQPFLFRWDLVNFPRLESQSSQCQLPTFLGWALSICIYSRSEDNSHIVLIIPMTFLVLYYFPKYVNSTILARVCIDLVVGGRIQHGISSIWSSTCDNANIQWTGHFNVYYMVQILLLRYNLPFIATCWFFSRIMFYF
jgi:hypothetical protein